MNKKFGKLFIIDASYQLHRNLHQPDLSELKSSDGTHTGAIFGFLRSLNRGINAIQTGYYPVLCWDSRVSPRRLELYDNYKHTIDKKKDKLISEVAKGMIETPELVDPCAYSDDDLQLIKIKMNELLETKALYGTYDDPNDSMKRYIESRTRVIDICNSLGIPSLYVKNWEGDDLMTLLTRVTENSVIMTDDSDLRQLISDNVSVLRVLKEVKLLTRDSIQYPTSKYLATIKAIVGDKSDNIPQVAFRLGEKSAEKLAYIIHECDFDSNKYLPRILELKGKPILEFAANHKDFLRNQQLVDLDFVPDDEEVYDTMFNEIKYRCDQGNYLNALQKISRLEINSIDLDNIVTNVTISRRNLFI